MQFSRDLRDEVAAGAVTVSVRLWSRSQVRVGGRYPVAGAVIEVTSIEVLPFGAITADDVRRSGERDRESLRSRAAHAGPIDDDTAVHRIEFIVVEPAVLTSAVEAAAQAHAGGNAGTTIAFTVVGSRRAAVSAASTSARP